MGSWRSRTYEGCPVGGGDTHQMEHCVRLLRDGIKDAIFPVLLQWLRHATKSDDNDMICVLNAHVALLLQNVTYQELTREAVMAQICAHITVNTRYFFKSEVSMRRPLIALAWGFSATPRACLADSSLILYDSCTVRRRERGLPPTRTNTRARKLTSWTSQRLRLVAACGGSGVEKKEWADASEGNCCF